MSETIYKVVLHRDVVSEIGELPKKTRTRVKEVIDGLASVPFPVGAERLKGRQNAYRIRVSDYRILYEVHASEVVVYVFGVAHRREVYLRLLRRR